MSISDVEKLFDVHKLKSSVFPFGTRKLICVSISLKDRNEKLHFFKHSF